MDTLSRPVSRRRKEEEAWRRVRDFSVRDEAQGHFPEDL
jgi:hypothetical protein